MLLCVLIGDDNIEPIERCLLSDLLVEDNIDPIDGFKSRCKGSADDEDDAELSDGPSTVGFTFRSKALWCFELDEDEDEEELGDLPAEFPSETLENFPIDFPCGGICVGFFLGGGAGFDGGGGELVNAG